MRLDFVRMLLSRALRLARASRAGALAVCLAMCVCGPAWAAPQAPDTLEALDASLEQILSASGIPGASIVVIESGAVAFTKDYGFADMATQTPVTADTVFRAGSISKSFTSLGVMMLVEEGRLDLDSRLADLLPEVAFDNPWEATDPVRLVHLLEHTTGFNDIGFQHYLIQGSHLTIADAVRLYGPYRSRWRPGTLQSYCNAGPVLAGRIMETVSGVEFSGFITQRLTRPLGMSSAYWTLDPAISGQMSRSYRADNRTEEPFMEIPGKPSGSLNITARDLARLPMLMLGRGQVDGVRYLTADSIARIESPTTSNAARAGLRVGHGLGNVSDASGRVLFHGHDGSIDGFVATYAYAPSINGGYVVMTNATSDSAIEASERIRAYLQRDAPRPETALEPIEDARIARWEGQYQTIVPRQQLLAAVIGLTQWEGAQIADGRLMFRGTTLQHVADGFFQPEGGAAPALVFSEDPDGVRLYFGESAYRRVPLWEMAAKLGGVGLFAIALAAGLAHALIWIPSAVMGRLASRGGMLQRLTPALAIMAAAGAFLAPLVLLATNDLDVLGRPSPAGWAAFAVSLAAPVLVGLAVVTLIHARPGASPLVRSLAWTQAALALAACAYLGAHGWIGMRIWEA